MRIPLFGMLLVTCGITFLAAGPSDFDSQIDALISRMTLEEKLGQMSQTNFPKQLTPEVREQIRRGRWGSFFNGGTPAEKAEAQRVATEESRLHIPIVYAQDVIHGYHTVFPIPLGQSASWDPELVRQAARIAAREAAAEGIHWTFAPMMDIARDARWGRIAESLGEDPYLSGTLAAAMIRGFQGDSLAAPDSVAACAKHFAGYGAAEGGRDYNTTWIPEPLLRDVYLKPFQMARQAGVASYMSAFNDLNGAPASANVFTLRKVLREEWKFDSVVVSDYTAVSELIPHGFAADGKDAARKAMQAGVDMEMVSTHYFENGKALVESGALDVRVIDDEVRNILRLKFRLGLFGERKQPVARPAAASAADLEVARKLAAESLVLLKNQNGVLPLAKPVKVAVIGPLADKQSDQMGTWSMNGEKAAVRTPLTALRETLGADRVVYSPGLQTSSDTSRAGFAAALTAARSADVVLLFLGEEAALSGEASSRSILNLPGAQEELTAEVVKAARPVVTVVMAGRPLTFHNVAQQSSAVLYAWHPGVMGGPAIRDILLGMEAPSGRLTATFPRSVGQEPLYYNHMNTGRPATETGPNIKDKFRSKYLDVPFTPEYPFGYGLSYTTFAYTNVQVSSSTVQADGKVTVHADVANTGRREADEVVQLYTRRMAASLTQPVRELKAFRRVHLRAGEKQTVAFDLNAADLAFTGLDGRLSNEAGVMQVWIAPDSDSGVRAEFRIVR